MPATAEPAGGDAGVAAQFAALGDETRLGLLRRLGEGGPQSLSRLCFGAAVTRQAVTRHLDVLERAGLVSSRREGRERVFELAPAALDDARRHLARIEARWDAALSRLRQLLESPN